MVTTVQKEWDNKFGSSVVAETEQFVGAMQTIPEVHEMTDEHDVNQKAMEIHIGHRIQQWCTQAAQQLSNMRRRDAPAGSVHVATSSMAGQSRDDSVLLADVRGLPLAETAVTASAEAATMHSVINAQERTRDITVQAISKLLVETLF